MSAATAVAGGGTGGTATDRSARSGAAGLLGAAASGAFGLLLTVVITRSFGVDGAGAIFVAIGLLTIAMVACCLGADTGLVWALPRRARGAGEAGRLLPVAVLPAVAVAVLVATAGAVLAPRLGPVLLPELGAGGVALLRVTSVAVPVATLALLLLAAVRGLRPIGAYVGVNMLLVPAARPVLVLAAAVAGGGVLLGMVGWVAPLGLAIVVCLVLLARPLRRDRQPDLGRQPGAGRQPDVSWQPRAGRQPDIGGQARAGRQPGTDPRPAWRAFWSFALPRAASAAVDAGSVWIAVLLVAVLAGQAEAGVFGAVGRYVLAGLLAMQGLRIAVAPQLSRLLGAGRRDDAAAVHYQTTSWVIMLSWPGYLLLAAFAPGFLALFGPGFSAGSAALAVLAVVMLVRTGLGNVQTLLLMSGHSGWHLAAVLAGLASTVALALVLVPAWGLPGAAVAWGAGIVVESVTAAVAAGRVLGRPVVTARLVRTGAGAILLAGAPVAVAGAVAGRGIPGLAVALVLLAATGLLLLAHRGVRHRIRALVRSWRDGR